MRTLQRATRELLVDDPGAIDEPDSVRPEATAIARERRAAVHCAVGRLAGRQRHLLASMLVGPCRTYEELSSLLDMPMGSIGPTRERALATLRRDPELERAVS